MSNIIFISNARLSFPSLVEPRSSVDTPGAKKKYSVDVIIKQDNPSFAQFMAEVQAVAVAKWGEHANNVLSMIQNDRKLRCYGSGNEKIDKKTFKPYVGYEGMAYISANKEDPPQMIQADGSAVAEGNTMAYQALARKMYGGCYVNIAVRPWTQDNTHGRGIRCDLIAVQFAGDGEAFGEGRADASSMFGQVAAVDAPAPAPSFTGFAVTPSFLSN